MLVIKLIWYILATLTWTEYCPGGGVGVEGVRGLAENDAGKLAAKNVSNISSVNPVVVRVCGRLKDEERLQGREE